MGLILSIDVGTTNIKAALVDENGHLCGEARNVSTKIEGDATGRAEHDPQKLHAAQARPTSRIACSPSHSRMPCLMRDGEV